MSRTRFVDLLRVGQTFFRAWEREHLARPGANETLALPGVVSQV
jgi:cbb3-type cytochrome oxidase cytochrome c subunit